MIVKSRGLRQSPKTEHCLMEEPSQDLRGKVEERKLTEGQRRYKEGEWQCQLGQNIQKNIHNLEAEGNLQSKVRTQLLK